MPTRSTKGKVYYTGTMDNDVYEIFIAIRKERAAQNHEISKSALFEEMFKESPQIKERLKKLH
jgi:hypothetical protein